MQSNRFQPQHIVETASDGQTPRRPSPVVKWAGGKARLLATLEKFYPAAFEVYYEPFLGGGAVFFHLWSIGKIKRAVISDCNKALINCYVGIRDHLEALLSQLEQLQKRANDKAFYYRVARPRFNHIGLTGGLEGNVEKAALFIYLNKTCYNGVYRVNGTEEFNVPWGRHKNPKIFDEEVLHSVHAVLTNPDITLRCEDYSSVIRHAKKEDFVYLDPPYHPRSPTSNFTDYTANGFGWDDQERLAKCVSRLCRRGCLVMMSNSHTSKVRQLYDAIQDKGRLRTIQATRAISCTGAGRGRIPEYLLTSYPAS